mmetsp:Transcript_20100/g.57678  ORF Transcript_20100/g.57678 Transcript_20100/m.57678 type:complete len:976 (+) Transcript_20100:148-3075(+)
MARQQYSSLPTLILATAVTCVLAFVAGTACRVLLFHPRSHDLSVVDGFHVILNVLKDGRGDTSYADPDRTNMNHNSNDDRAQKRTMSAAGKQNLPAPRLHGGKEMPQTRYTGRAFPENGRGRDAVRSSHDLHIQPVPNASDDNEDVARARKQQECLVNGTEENINETCRSSSNTDTRPSEDDSGAAADADADADASPPGQQYNTTNPPPIDEDEEHLPAGQHLLVDIKNVDADFLNSEERLAEAMVEVVALSELTLLSYHCHGLIPEGVSCVGVLLESHISFHTWPDEGVITLDLFTCGSGLLVPVVPVIERLFGVPLEGAGEYHPPDGTAGDDIDEYIPQEEDYIPPPRMVWSHVLRGFRPEIEGGWRPLEADIGDTLAKLELNHKKVMTTTVTPYQQIDVLDVIDPLHGTARSYERSLHPEIATYESMNPELYRPNRKVYLDGVLQSTSRGDEAYHEALVHPAMFAHEGPERVAIIGGGEGATLREVLKHSTLEEVKMIEIDEVMVNASREALPGWSDCSDLEGSAPSCFDDPRTDLRCEDALAWFIDRFSEDMDDSSDDEEEDDSSDDDEGDDIIDVDAQPFDVIIMDALDPQDNIEFADALYNNDVFLNSLYRALTDEGVLVLQLGESPHNSDPPEQSNNKNRHHIMNMIEDVGFQSMHIYEESHCGFGYPWSFLVACKSDKCRFNWYMNEAEIDLQIHYRMKRTKAGSSPLRYFDGATMKSYQDPPKAWETLYCRREPFPEHCNEYRGYRKSIENYSIDNFEVRMSSIGDGAGRGVFAKVDIPQDSFIAVEESHKKVHFSHTTTYMMEIIKSTFSEAVDLSDLTQYAYGYGFQRKSIVSYEYYVDTSILTFINHGCNGTNNFGERHFNTIDSMYGNEAQLDPNAVGVPPSSASRGSIFNPLADRNCLLFVAGNYEAKRVISSGNELYQNYIYFITDPSAWVEEVMSIKAQCKGEILSNTVKGAELRARKK